MTGRILLVGPLGDAPAETSSDVATRLRGRGYEVDVHNPATEELVITYPDPYNPRSRAESSLPSFLWERARAYARWRRKVRPVLKQYSLVVAWDPLVCVLLRFAASSGTRVVWSPTQPVVHDAWNAVLVRLARSTAHGVVGSGDWYTSLEEVATR